MRGRRRHPALETAFFAAVLFMAVFVGRELWRRLNPNRAIRLENVIEPYGEATLPTDFGSGISSPMARSERAVTAVPPLQLTLIERHKPKPIVVPAPATD